MRATLGIQWVKSNLWCYFTSDINKENMVCSKYQNKDGAQTKFIDNFPKHFLLLFERNQYNFQMKYSILVDTRIKCVDNLSFSFCSMVDICGMPLITPSYLQLLVRVEEI